MAGEKNLKFNMNIARKVVDDFYISTKIRCLLLDSEGTHLYWAGGDDVCGALARVIGRSFNCSEMHGKAVSDALRFGGRYIYSCPMGFAFFASPVMDGGALSGALIAGPVQIMESDDQLSGAAFNVYDKGHDIICAAKEALGMAPKKSFEELQALSRILFANAVYISDSTNFLYDVSLESDSRDAVYNYIEYLKNSEGDRVPYPIDKEQELFRSIERGDQEMASVLLNQILGHIYFYAVDNEEVYTRIQELLVVLMRAVACGGADISHILDSSRRYQAELRSLRTQDELTSWLASRLQVLMDQVSEISDAKHSASISRAINYMKQKYALNPTLEEVAEYAGYSASYFSRIFKKDTGRTFSELLNDIRIDKSKTLLLTSDLSIADISNMLGYNDQSYFCRIFKQVTGTTPDRFRKRSRRIDQNKEYAQKKTRR